VASFLHAVVKAIATAAVKVLISFREWLHSYRLEAAEFVGLCRISSHLFQRVASFLHPQDGVIFIVSTLVFSSLSESGFIPTVRAIAVAVSRNPDVLISFREWLHSYTIEISMLLFAQ